jgi:DNA-binding response OmpR family regulator
VRVLVVEDQADIAVDIALDGPGGLDGALTSDHDVVVLDRDLPGLHGDEVCVRLTAAADSGDLVDGLGLGADGYLAKPFDFPVLVARVRALARRSHPAAPPVLRVASSSSTPRSGEPPGPGGHSSSGRKNSACSRSGTSSPIRSPAQSGDPRAPK